MGLEFSTAVIKAAEDELEPNEDGRPEPTPFTVIEEKDGEVVREVECLAYYPGDGQIGMLLAQVDRSKQLSVQVAGCINFFMEVLDEESYAYLAGRLMAPDYKDPFGLAEVTAIAKGLVQEWTGRPTKASGSSTTSLRATGRKSTPATTRST